MKYELLLLGLHHGSQQVLLRNNFIGAILFVQQIYQQLQGGTVGGAVPKQAFKYPPFLSIEP